jgi:hypothetical protein
MSSGRFSLALLLASGTIASAGGKANLASSYSEKEGLTASGEAFSPAKLVAFASQPSRD